MNSSPRSVNYSIIPNDHGMETRVLLIPEEDGWSLPTHPHREAAAINATIKELFGLDVTTLECVREYTAPPGGDLTSRVYAHENHHGAELSESPGARWMSEVEAMTVQLARPEHRDVLESWFAECRTGTVPARRLPWARRGWHAEVSAWAVAQLHALGTEVTGPVEQLDVGLWSGLLRVPTTRGLVYFKAVGPSFAHEPALTRALAEWFPRHTPNVLAIDTERGWMLTEDFGQVADPKSPEEIIEAYMRVIPFYSRMQVETVSHAKKISALGCPDRPISKFPELYEQLLSETSLLHLGAENGLTYEEHERLAGYLPAFTALCHELSESGIPDTLVHGDVWRGNFTLGSDPDHRDPVIFDWAESSVTHPFFALTIVLRDIRESVPEKSAEESVSRVLDAYLEPWSDFAPRDLLAETLRLSAAPGIVNRTLEWRNNINALEPGRAMFYEYAVSLNLRRLLPFTF